MISFHTWMDEAESIVRLTRRIVEMIGKMTKKLEEIQSQKELVATKDAD